MLRRLGGIVSVDWLQRLVRCIVNRGKTWLDRVQSKKSPEEINLCGASPLSVQGGDTLSNYCFYFTEYVLLGEVNISSVSTLEYLFDLNSHRECCWR